MVCRVIRAIAMVVVCIPCLQSCSASPTVPDFYGVGSAEEQKTIAEHYRTEAAVFRQRADQMEALVTTYRELFGEESEWVSGARALNEYYQRAAQERELLAEQYQAASVGAAPLEISPRTDPSSPN